MYLCIYVCMCIYICIYIYIYIYVYMCIYTYIYIYICIERERERHVLKYIYIYIYICIYSTHVNILYTFNMQPYRDFVSPSIVKPLLGQPWEVALLCCECLRFSSSTYCLFSVLLFCSFS